MSTKIKKLAAGLLVLAMMAVFLPGQMLTAFAATGKITFSDPSVTVGNQVTVSMKITTDGAEGLGASDVMLEYDSSALEFVSGTSANGGAGSVRVLGTMESVGQTTFNFSLTFKTLKAGTTNITVKSQEVYDSNSQAVSLSHVGSSAVKVNAPATYSRDANLSSLTISPGELSPAFSPDVTDYTATVSGDVEKITVSAPANDSKATVVVSGNDGLQIGENEIVCKVTAEDGTTVKNYTIKVTKTEGGETPEASEPADAGAEGSGMTAAVGEENWQVAASFDEAALPAGFTSTQIDYNGTQVQAGWNEAEGLTLLYMTNDAGEGDFFLYNSENGTFAPYVTVKMAEKTIIVLPVSEIPEGTEIPDGFEACSIDIGSHTVSGWIWAADDDSVPEYCVVYGMNSNGEKNFYRYDQKEMTLQRYFQDPDAESAKTKLASLAEEYNSLLDDYSIRGWLIVGLFAVCIVLIIVLIVLLLKKPGSPGRGGTSYDLDYGAERQTGAERQEAGRYDRRDTAGRRNGRRYESEDPDDGYGDIEDADEEVYEGRGRNTAADRRPTGRRDAEPDFEDEEIEDLDADFDDPEEMEPQNGRRSQKPAKEAGRSVEEDDDFEFIDLDL